MKARRLIDGASYHPETLKVMGEAFDQAWAEIAGCFSDEQVEMARTKLAEALLATATDGASEVDALRRGALVVMARDYRSVLRSRESSD